MSDRQQLPNVNYIHTIKFITMKQNTGDVNKLKNETEVRISSRNEEEVE